jgi:lipopolysaccharide transport system ATP-binding protein
VTDTAAVVVDAVSKTYRLHRRPRSLKEAALRPFAWSARARTVAALRDVSFAVRPGSSVGIVGPNGAGKSTLLRLVGGVGRPDSGRIETDGRIAAILELGAAFHPELTGREAASLAGIVAGLTRREVRARLDAIVAFAGLEAFVDEPLRTYSTGMQARLGFAIAAHTDPEILLVDEVLAVGDAAFQRRCIERLRQFQRDGVTMLIVSHDHHVVAELCDEVVWLRGGALVAVGAPNEIVRRYVDAVDRETTDSTPASTPAETTRSGATLRPRVNRFGSLEGRIAAVELTDGLGSALGAIAPGHAVVVGIEADTPDAAGEPVVSVSVTRDDGLLGALPGLRLVVRAGLGAAVGPARPRVRVHRRRGADRSGARPARRVGA